MTLSISDSAAAVSDADLAAVERRLGVHFPDDYRAFLLRHNGGVPRQGRFRMSRQAAEAGMEWGRVTADAKMANVWPSCEAQWDYACRVDFAVVEQDLGD